MDGSTEFVGTIPFMGERADAASAPIGGAIPGGAIWLPLLRRLASVAPSGGVWKNADAALAGIGDVDFTASEDRWDLIVEEFRGWAAQVGAEPVVVCRHVPDTLLVIGVDEARPELLQLDVRGRATFRGSTVLKANDLIALMRKDGRGFRVLRPGSEGLLKLVLKGLGLGGRPKWDRLRRERVAELLRQDPEGKVAAASLFGPARTAVIAGADAVVRGGWRRAAMLEVEATLAARMLREPSVVLRRAAFRLTGNDCPVVRSTMRHGRKIPADTASWMAKVVTDHDVYGRTEGSA
jgi:hypothetical protein